MIVGNRFDSFYGVPCVDGCRVVPDVYNSLLVGQMLTADVVGPSADGRRVVEDVDAETMVDVDSRCVVLGVHD